MTNATNLVSQSEPQTPKVIMVGNKIRTDVSLLFVRTGAILNPEKRIPRKKRNMKSPEMSPPRKDIIQNQDNNKLSTEKDQSFPPNLETFPPGFKSIINEAHYHNITEDDRNDYTDTSHNDKEYYVNNLKVINKKDIDDKSKDGNSSDHNCN